MFVGREEDLARLRRELDTPRPSLVVMQGRRRIGKSTLIKEAVATRPFVYFQAIRDVRQSNLDSFKTAVIDAIGDDGIIGNMADWYTALNHLALVAERLPNLVVALDEFPYLCEADASLPSVIQKFIDSGAPRRGNLNLILCGSTVSFMEGLLLERQPLYGRHTAKYDIGPLSLREASEFFPRYAPIEAVTAYAIFGGVPYYLAACDPQASLERNIIDTLLTEDSRLVEEPMNLLRSETQGSPRFFGALHALADGCNKSSEIRNRIATGDGTQDVGWYLARLAALRIIRVEKSEASNQERNRRYVIDDPLARFWFRFVQPNMSAVGRGLGERLYRSRIAPRMPDYMGDAFEEICREHVRRHGEEFLPSPANNIGKIWSADYDLDVADDLIDPGLYVFGECKWRNQQITEEALDHLVECAGKTHYGADALGRHWALFSRSGFTPALNARAASDPMAHLLTPDDLVPGRR